MEKTNSSTILISVTDDEMRVAMLSEGGKLLDYKSDNPRTYSKIDSKGNILKARIMRVESSLEVVFVDFGGNRQGFLPFREININNFIRTNSPDQPLPALQNVLHEGQELMIQIVKGERGTKGAAVTNDIILPGNYVVLMANNPNSGGISRRIEGDERDGLREVLNQLKVPDGMSVIIRTAGAEKSIEELQWDLEILLQQWDAIQRAYHQRPAPFLIHQESDVLIRTIRDHLRKNVKEIVIDNVQYFNRAKHYIEIVRPDFSQRVKLYQNEVPLFSRFQIERQIKSAFDREVRLPSGGSIVIDRTEALTSIDVNSARATQGGSIEETALNTNLEAAEEIARQLRIRDIGGLIVIDFIDMAQVNHQREVENRMREITQTDRAKIQIGRISRFGLLEMSRQRLHPVLGETDQIVCPQCHGQGNIHSVEALSVMMLRIIEETAAKEKPAQVRAQLPLEAATFLLNEKRHQVEAIAARYEINLIVIPNPHIKLPEYRLQTIGANQLVQEDEDIESLLTTTPSYELLDQPKELSLVYDQNITPTAQAANSPTPAVKTFVPEKRPEEPGLIRKLWNALFGSQGATTAAPARNSGYYKQQDNKQRRHRRRPRSHHQGNNSGGYRSNGSGENSGYRGNQSSNEGYVHDREGHRERGGERGNNNRRNNNRRHNNNNRRRDTRPNDEDRPSPFGANNSVIEPMLPREAENSFPLNGPEHRHKEGVE